MTLPTILLSCFFFPLSPEWGVCVKLYLFLELDMENLNTHKDPWVIKAPQNMAQNIHVRNDFLGSLSWCLPLPFSTRIHQELNHRLFSEWERNSGWMVVSWLGLSAGQLRCTCAFLQAATSASWGRPFVLCQLRITEPFLGHRGGKQANAGLSEMLSTPAAGNPLLPCPAQPTRRVGLMLFLIHRCDNSYCLPATVD